MDPKARLAVLQEKAKKSKNTEKEINDLARQVNDFSVYLLEIDKSMRLGTKHEKALTVFRNEKRKAGLVQIQHAINTACYLVTNQTDYYLSSQDKHSQIVRKVIAPNGKEMELSIGSLEGDGLQSLLSLLLNSQILCFNANIVPILILDEAVAALSEENKSKLGELLQYMKDDFYIVGIEQFASTYDSIASRIYAVDLVDNLTQIRQVS